MTNQLNTVTTSLSLALAVKELEPGEFHWILLDETPTGDELLSYTPQSVSKSHRDPVAAWIAGYLAVRATLRVQPCMRT